MPERRQTIDTEELKQLIAEAVSSANHCQFPENQRVALRKLSEIDPNVLSTLAKMYTDATSNLWKGFLALCALGAIVLAGFGAWFKLGGK